MRFANIIEGAAAAPSTTIGKAQLDPIQFSFVSKAHVDSALHIAVHGNGE